jgi:hypothetical protein
MNDFCLFACSDEFQLSNGLEFVRITQNLCQQLGFTLKYMDYAFAEDELDFSKTETVINSESMHQLDRILRERTVTELLLWSDNEASVKPPYVHLNSEFRDTETDNYKYACIYFSMKLLENWSMEKLFSSIRDLLTTLNSLGRLDYVLITTMKTFLPQTYFRGIFTPGLNQGDALNLAMWERKFVDRKKKLRGLYWGNLLNSGHLAQIISKKELLDILDSLGCLYTPINGDDLFFMFPSSELSTSSRDLVEALMKKYDLLMEPDNEAGDDVNRYLILGS